MRTLLRNCSYSVALVHILLPTSCHLKASLWALFSSSSLNNSPETKLSGSPSVSMYVLCLFSFLFVSTLSSLSNTSPSPLRTSITPVLPSLSTHTWILRHRGQPLGAAGGGSASNTEVPFPGVARRNNKSPDSTPLAAWKSPHKQHTGLTAQWKELRLALCRLGR